MRKEFNVGDMVFFTPIPYTRTFLGEITQVDNESLDVEIKFDSCNNLGGTMQQWVTVFSLRLASDEEAMLFKLEN